MRRQRFPPFRTAERRWRNLEKAYRRLIEELNPRTLAVQLARPLHFERPEHQSNESQKNGCACRPYHQPCLTFPRIDADPFVSGQNDSTRCFGSSRFICSANADNQAVRGNRCSRFTPRRDACCTSSRKAGVPLVAAIRCCRPIMLCRCCAATCSPSREGRRR